MFGKRPLHPLGQGTINSVTNNVIPQVKKFHTGIAFLTYIDLRASELVKVSLSTFITWHPQTQYNV